MTKSLTTLVYKDLSGNEFIFDSLSEETEEKLSAIGLLTPFKINSELLYHLDLSKDKHYTTTIPQTKLSFAKGRRTYGGIENYWEAATIQSSRKIKVRGIMGYMTEEDLLKYVSYIFEISKIDDWFKKMPLKFYNAKSYEDCNEIKQRILNLDYPQVGAVGGASESKDYLKHK